jgi:hypothetical protein
MALYRLVTDVDRFDVALPPRSAGRPFLTFDGRPRAAGWTPFEAELDPSGTRGNFLGFSTHVPVVDAKAWEALRPLAGPHVEALEMRLAGEPIYALNVTTVLDCLDRERSEIRHYDSGGIMDVARYVFRPGCLGDTPIFKQKGLEMSDVFVDEVFRRAVTAAGLKGARFVPLP